MHYWMTVKSVNLDSAAYFLCDSKGVQLSIYTILKNNMRITIAQNLLENFMKIKWENISKITFKIFRTISDTLMSGH